MLVYRCEDEKAIKINNNNNCILEMKFISDEFVVIINTDDKITITKELDPYFYNHLSRFMENRYIFNNPYSSKTPTKLVWLSDQYIDVDKPNGYDLVNRLVIEKVDDSFQIYYYNPFFKQLGIKKASHLIAFSPAGNGNNSKNIETERDLQTEFVSMVQDIFYKKEIPEKKKNLNK